MRTGKATAAVVLAAAMMTGAAYGQGLQPATPSKIPTIEWDMPTENVDGTPIRETLGAKLYYGTKLGVYELVVDAGLASEVVLTNLQWNTTYHCAATAYPTNDVLCESAFSLELVFSTRQAPPNPPANVRAPGTVVILK